MTASRKGKESEGERKKADPDSRERFTWRPEDVTVRKPTQEEREKLVAMYRERRLRRED